MKLRICILFIVSVFMVQQGLAQPASRSTRNRQRFTGRTAPGGAINRPAVPVRNRHRVYHQQFRYQQGRFYRGNRAYVYYGGRYVPDNRVFINGRMVYREREYVFVSESGRYYLDGTYYYYDYTTGHLIHDTRIFRQGRYYHRGVWYVYRDGRYFNNDRYYYYVGGEYYPEDEVPDFEIEELDAASQESSGVSGANPGVAGAIYYVCRRLENRNWVYYYRAYNPSDIKVSGPYTLDQAKEKVEQYNNTVSSRLTR